MFSDTAFYRDKLCYMCWLYFYLYDPYWKVELLSENFWFSPKREKEKTSSIMCNLFKESNELGGYRAHFLSKTDAKFFSGKTLFLVFATSSLSLDFGSVFLLIFCFHFLYLFILFINYFFNKFFNNLDINSAVNFLFLLLFLLFTIINL